MRTKNKKGERCIETEKKRMEKERQKRGKRNKKRKFRMIYRNKKEIKEG